MFDGRAGTGVRFAVPGGRWAVLWWVFVAVTAVLAALKPLRPITRIYQASALDWWSGVPVYTGGIHGFLYFPSSAFLFGPLAALPLPLLDQVWRLIQAGILAWAVWRAARLLLPDGGDRMAPRVLALVIPAVSINLLRGQWELIMAAVLLHAAVDAAWGRWVRGGLILALAVALKPLALVPALLFAVVRPRLIPPLALGLTAAFALPFLHPNPAYVLDQYAAMTAKLLTAAEPDSGRWFNLTMLLNSLGLGPSYGAMTGVRLAAALATLAAAWVLVRRLDGRSGAMAVLWLAFAYLALFNPRTEEGTYANIALMAALAACAEAARTPRGVRPVLLGAAALALGTHTYGDWLYRPTETWIKQAVTLALYAYPLWLAATHRAWAEPVAEPPAPDTYGWRRDRVALAACLAVPVLIGLAHAPHRLPALGAAAAACVTLGRTAPARRWLKGL